MATYSEAVNLNSFLRGIESRINSVSLNTINISLSAVKKLTGIPAAFTDTQQAISVYFAKRMLNNLRLYLGYSGVNITYDYQALSLNTARSLLDKWLPKNIRVHVQRAGSTSTTLGAPFYQEKKYLILNTGNNSSTSVAFSYRGGQGGGSGALACDGDKNAKYTVKSGAGSPGETTWFELNNTRYTAQGGSGGSSRSLTVSANPSEGTWGYNGSSGSAISKTFTIQDFTIFKGYVGKGGDGGAGVAISQGNSNTYNYSSNKTGVTSVGWTNEHYFGGGGGAGGNTGHQYSNSVYNYSGATYKPGTSSTTNFISSTSRSGGRGGYCSNVSVSSTSGTGGQYYQAENNTHCATGGSGGASGYIAINASEDLFFIEMTE